MQIVDISNWGFLLEHDGMPFFMPVGPKLPMQMQSRVQIKEDLVVVIKTGDYPFFIDRDGVGHIIMNDSDYARMIKECVVHHVMRR